MVVHLSSMDSFAERAGLKEALALAGRMKDAILAHEGPIYVVDQRWSFTRWSEPRYRLVHSVQLQRDIEWVHFDDLWEKWDIFLRHFRARLKRDGITHIVLGGVWYHPEKEMGCVSDAYLSLRRLFHVKVDELIVGCWPTVA